MHRLHRHTYRANGGGEAQVASVFQVETPERAKHEKRMRDRSRSPVLTRIPQFHLKEPLCLINCMGRQKKNGSPRTTRTTRTNT